VPAAPTPELGNQTDDTTNLGRQRRKT
jgi:hypothetical protein